MTAWTRSRLCVALLLLMVLPAAGGQSAWLVREGDTLSGISRKLQVPVGVLQVFNGIADPNKLKPGTSIRVPAVHVVQKGETLYGIARQAGASLDQLRELNGLKGDATIRPGDRIFLPATARVAASETGPEPSQAGSQTPGRATVPPHPSTDRPPDAGKLWPVVGKREPWALASGRINGVTIQASRGDRVVSVCAGEVKWAGPYWALGKAVIVTTADGHILTYAGNEELLVRKGDRVTEGMAIARLGINPTEGKAILYFSVLGRRQEYVDPEKFVDNS